MIGSCSCPVLRGAAAIIGIAAVSITLCGPAAAQTADAGTDVQFCDTGAIRGSTDCHPDSALLNKVATANAMFERKDYTGASHAFLDAFADTPLRPVGGRTQGLMIASLNETGQFGRAIEEVLRRDRLTAPDNYALWSDLAIVARRLAVSTSLDAAQHILATAYEKFPSKLQSQVWALLPRGTIGALSKHEYGTEFVYGRETQHPEIRRDIERFVASHPTEPFIEFAYFTIGQYDAALAANPKSIISDVLHYARGYSLLSTLFDASEQYQQQHPEVRNELQPLGTILPDFRTLTDAARPDLEAVLREAPHSPHADDAAFWLGWIACQQGNNEEALRYFGEAMIVGNGDYKGPAIRWSIRIIANASPAEQVVTVKSSQGLRSAPAAWYVASRSAYRQFDYALAIDTAKQALQQFNMPIDRVPATTDPQAIDKALTGILFPKARTDDWNFIDPNLEELYYLIEAGHELSDYEAWLKSRPTISVAEVSARAHAIIVKFSTINIDYRQAIRAIDVTFDHTARAPAFSRLREWLYYRKVRLLVSFAPQQVEATVSAMEREFPTGDLTDDALAEQLYAQAAIFHNLAAARATFRTLNDRFPQSNALDNAYNWMAIMLYCRRQADEAKRVDLDIIRRFPLTRFAYYAIIRLAKPPSGECDDGRFTGPDSREIYQARAATTIYVGASRLNAVLLKVAAGARLVVAERQGDWYAVRLGRRIGYIPVADVKCSGCENALTDSPN